MSTIDIENTTPSSANPAPKDVTIDLSSIKTFKLAKKPLKKRKDLKKSTSKTKKQTKTANKESEYEKQLALKTKKYIRADSIPSAKGTKHKKEKILVTKNIDNVKMLAKKAARAEILKTEEPGYIKTQGMEKSFKLTQKFIERNVDINTAQKRFDLALKDFGPYFIDYTRNGKFMLLGGRKGHIASIDWKSAKIVSEFHVRETVRDVQYLHNESLFAIAQKKYAYIYDRSGAEVHCLRKMIETQAMNFLPYHYLLAGVGNQGILRYQDVSTGQVVAEHKTRLGPCKTLCTSEYNSIQHLGHSNGTVTLWSPSSTEPLVKMLCHKGPVNAIGIDRAGMYMATSGLDGQLRIWDIRNYKVVHSYHTFSPASCIDISQLGLLSVGHGPHVTVWKDAIKTKAQSPYLSHLIPGSDVTSISFVPYEDTLGIGHTKGISSIIVPGSGEPNFDAYEANPYETSSQRRENEVRSLLDKLQPEMISLDPTFIGALSEQKSSSQTLAEEKERLINSLKSKDPLKVKKRGRNSAAKRMLRKKQMNVIDAKKLALINQIEKDKKIRQMQSNTDKDQASGPLSKFYNEKLRREYL
ncbi:hypothetical protein BB560_007103 [Smittium megazygosporum]|uniref:U three protein 7 n=1 Tax=Smittium megazygosporum TaxID=133381 RepID=A0A2T9XYR6_9FUNG|nr:hypothetical protein BB560_007103 [Smittium megazygosporum]